MESIQKDMVKTRKICCSKAALLVSRSSNMEFINIKCTLMQCHPSRTHTYVYSDLNILGTFHSAISVNYMPDWKILIDTLFNSWRIFRKCFQYKYTYI